MIESVIKMGLDVSKESIKFHEIANKRHSDEHLHYFDINFSEGATEATVISTQRTGKGGKLRIVKEGDETLFTNDEIQYEDDSGYRIGVPPKYKRKTYKTDYEDLMTKILTF